MSLPINLRELPIEQALAHVPFSDREHAFLAGSRAVEVHVGRVALLAARLSLGVESSGDVDLVVSSSDYKHLKEVGAHTIRHSFPRPSHPGRYYTRNSLSMADNAVDIWEERWYEAARYPRGVVGVEELAENSEWSAELGIWVLKKSYLIDQRERSVAFLEDKEAAGTITKAEKERLAKDRADLLVLRLEESEIAPSGAEE